MILWNRLDQRLLIDLFFKVFIRFGSVFSHFIKNIACAETQDSYDEEVSCTIIFRLGLLLEAIFIS